MLYIVLQILFYLLVSIWHICLLSRQQSLLVEIPGDNSQWLLIYPSMTSNTPLWLCIQESDVTNSLRWAGTTLRPLRETCGETDWQKDRLDKWFIATPSSKLASSSVTSSDDLWTHLTWAPSYLPSTREFLILVNTYYLKSPAPKLSRSFNVAWTFSH